jgi:RHS repeat-associated protein
MYRYDRNGNRTNAGYETGANNQLLSDGVYDYAYDKEGNLIRQTEIATGKVTQLSWDSRNRLIAVIDQDASGTVTQRVEYRYDLYDRRIAKIVDPDGAGAQAATTERYVYDRDNIALVFDGSGQQTHRYLFGLGIDQVLAGESQGQNLWALVNHQGTVTDVVDDAGSNLNHISYDSFGNVTDQTNPTVLFRFGYTGREADLETGFTYYRNRYTFNGRFISQDPLGFSAGDTNLYRYTANNPVNFNDPLGLDSRILRQLFSQSHIAPKSNSKKPSIYEFNTVFPTYSAAYSAARFWFHAIILIDNPTKVREGKVKSRVPFIAVNLLRDDLSADLPPGINYRGRAVFRPGSTSEPIEPTIQFQADDRDQWHNTLGYSNATELKFTYKEKNDKPCPNYLPPNPQERERAKRKAENAPAPILLPLPKPQPATSPAPVIVPVPVPRGTAPSFNGFGNVVKGIVEGIGTLWCLLSGGCTPKY